MVEGFKKDGKFVPTGDRSALGSSSVRELLPKQETEEDEERKSKRLGKFALEKAKQFAKGAKKAGSVAKAGAEKAKQKQIEKSSEKQERLETLDREIDDIIEDSSSSNARKFRVLQRFGLLHRKELSKGQLKIVNDNLKLLDLRQQRETPSSRPSTPQRQTITISSPPTSSPTVPSTTTQGLTQTEFDKLPNELQEQIKLASRG